MTTPTFDIGNVIRLKVVFTDIDGSAVDPTDVQLNVRLYGGDVETFTFGNGQVQRQATGIYYYDYTPSQPGLYYYRYIGSGDAVAAGDSTFSISSSQADGQWPPPPAC